jgi:hypothetical protein
MHHNMEVLLHVSYLLSRNPLAGRVDIPTSLCATENHRENFNDSWHFTNLKCFAP